MNTLERLERANPVADADRLLSAPSAMDDFVLAVKQRSGIVQTTDDQAPIEVPETQVLEIDQQKPIFQNDRRRGWVYGLAAAVVTLIFVGVAWALLSNDSEPDVAPQPGPTPTIVDTTPTTVPESVAPTSNLEEILTADGRFTTYLGLWDIVAIDGPQPLGNLLSQEATFTLFVPTDEAFAALPEGVLDDLKTATDLRLQGLLGYLSLPVEVDSVDLESRGRSIAVNGGTALVTNQNSDSRLTVGVDAAENIVIGGPGGPNSVVVPGEVATIIEVDLQASNGIIHVIDTVLIPPDAAGWGEGQTTE